MCRASSSAWISARIFGRCIRQALDGARGGAGASVIVNLSASNALIGKARERSELARVQSRA